MTKAAREPGFYRPDFERGGLGLDFAGGHEDGEADATGQPEPP